MRAFESTAAEGRALRLLATALLVGGCASGGAQAPAGQEPLPLTLASAVQAALADASRRTGLPATDLKVGSASAVTWRDGSLGCPQAGWAYTQALIPGYRVRIRAPDREYDYHAATRGGVVLCPPGRAVDPVPDERPR